MAGSYSNAQTFIGGSQITPSTTLPSVLGFTINQIADGITSDAPPYNGFASSFASGTITLDFTQTYNLGAFVIWNDVNVFAEGIAHFRLDFFNAALALQGSSPEFLAPQGQLAPATYSFASESAVRRVNLVVLDSNASPLGINRIEIREVGFLTAVSAIPEPSSAAMVGLGLFGVLVGMRRRS